MKKEKTSLKTLKEINIRYQELGLKKHLTLDESKESSEISKFYSEMSIERKKKKNGVFDYFIADKDGNVLEKISKDYFNGRQLGDGFNEFTYIDYLPTYEKKGNTVTDHGVYESTQEIGGESIELKTIFDNTGNKIIEGIRNIDSYNLERRDFVIELEPDFHKEWIAKLSRMGDLPYEFRKKRHLRCVIDGIGDFITEPTFGWIRFDIQTNKYISGN